MSLLHDLIVAEMNGGGGAVDSVNGKTGVVVLDASDVGALPDSTVIPAAVTEQTVAGWGYATETWVNNKGYMTLNDLPVYNGGVS